MSKFILQAMECTPWHKICQHNRTQLGIAERYCAAKHPEDKRMDCTLAPGHEGAHVACWSQGPHNASVWIDTPSTK